MNKCILVLLNGKAGSGKDTFSDLCKTADPNTEVVVCHRSDPYKDFLKSMGWDGVKTLEIREILMKLCGLGEEYGYNREYLLTQVFTLNTSLTNKNKLFIYHCRDYEAIQKLYEDKNLNKKTSKIEKVLIVAREGAEPLEPDDWYFNKSNNYNYVIINNGSIEDLQEKAVRFVKSLMEE